MYQNTIHQQISTNPGDSADGPYNYEHFRLSMLLEHLAPARKPEGRRPGEMAPDFTLSDLNGQTWTLSQLRGRPVVLIFGSGTCPLTLGATPALKQVYRDWSDRVQFLMVYVHEAHPGEVMAAHHSYAQKLEQAKQFAAVEDVSWPVLVDDLDGSVHRAYLQLPNPLFLIDPDGVIAFRGDSSHGPTLRRALEQLDARGMNGVVDAGLDRKTHTLGAMTYGWNALRRGGRVAVKDAMLGMLPMTAGYWIGHKLEPLLDPIARRSRPLPKALKLAAVTGVAGLSVIGIRTLKRSRH